MCKVSLDKKFLKGCFSQNMIYKRSVLTNIALLFMELTLMHALLTQMHVLHFDTVKDALATRASA